METSVINHRSRTPENSVTKLRVTEEYMKKERRSLLNYGAFLR